MGGFPDRSCSDLRLIHGADRAGRALDMRAHPIELRRIDTRQLDHGQLHLAVHRQKLCAKRILEALNRVLGRAIGRLQRNAAIRQRGTNQDDGAGALLKHVLERGAGAMHLPEVSDVSDPSIFIEAHVHKAREDACESVVHPDVYSTKSLDDLVRCMLNSSPVRDIGLDNNRFAAELLDVARGSLKAGSPPGEQRHLAAVLREFSGGGSSYPCRCTGDHNDFGQRSSPASFYRNWTPAVALKFPRSRHFAYRHSVMQTHGTRLMSAFRPKLTWFPVSQECHRLVRFSGRTHTIERAW